jgi:hypothetical protein
MTNIILLTLLFIAVISGGIWFAKSQNRSKNIDDKNNDDDLGYC